MKHESQPEMTNRHIVIWSVGFIQSESNRMNNFATSSADLGEGLSNSASSLATAGNDLGHSLAMLTGMSEITQSAPEAGNALKILAMRVRGYDEETDSYTNDTEELSGAIADLTKTAKTPGGISLFTDDTKQTYKDTYTLMEEISEIYDDLTDKNRAELLEKLAGKNRGNQIAALIQGFQSGQVQKAYQDTLNSDGSAQQEQDRWLESIEAKQQQFEAAFQKMATTTFSSDMFKGLIDGGTNLLNLFTNLTSSIGMLNTAAIGLGIFQGKTGSGKSTWEFAPCIFQMTYAAQKFNGNVYEPKGKDFYSDFLIWSNGNALLSYSEQQDGEPSQFKSLRHMVLIPNLFLIGIGGECESMR